jgi:beta-lactamase superfamily II metal-dependent hydrolase
MKSVKKLIALFAVTAMLFTGCSGTASESGTSSENTASSVSLETTETYNLTVDFLKVGKADAAVITTENHVVVIDCGEKTDGKKVRNCLNYLGRDTVDYMILTHYDQDHIGGAAKVINEFTVNNVFGADYDEPSDEYSALVEAMSAKNMTMNLITSAYTFSLDDAYFEIYPCQQKSYHDGNDNNHSLVIKMTHHDEVFLFTGDAMQERLVELMNIGDCDVLKEPYHGREVANLADFLDKVTPEYAIVTTDEENYADSTAQALADRNIETYVTFRDGNIRCTSTGSSVSFETGLNFKEDDSDVESSAEETN